MKRLHVSLAVARDDLDRAVGFYATLFGASPTVLQPGYAKWMLDDPRMNFVLDGRAGNAGVDHMGIQVETAEELDEVAARLRNAGSEVREQQGAHCCYARSDKAWVADPQGILWETFLTHGLETQYGEDRAPRVAVGAAACCEDEAGCCAGD